MQRSWICARFEVNPRASYPSGNIFWSHRQRAIESGGHFFIAPQSLVSKRDLLEYGKIVRVQLQRLVHFLERFPPPTLPSVDVARHQGNSVLVRQRPLSGSQFLP